MIYLDSAAVVKLAHAEPESAALRGWLDERAETPWISSVLTEIESFRALVRYAPEATYRLPAVLDQIDLIDLDQHIRMLARAVTPATVRSLDAIHLGTALRSGPSLTSFVTYDKRLLEAAQAAGLPIDSPVPTAPQSRPSSLSAPAIGYSASKSRSDATKRPADPAYLPSQARLDRSPPGHRVRRPGRQPPDRDHHRLEHQEIRPHRLPIPHHHHPGRSPTPSPRPTPSPTTSGQPWPRSTAPARVRGRRRSAGRCSAT